PTTTTTPAGGSAGTYHASLPTRRSSDLANATASATTVLTIGTAANTQPAITAPATASGTEGTALATITATATDADAANTLTITQAGRPHDGTPTAWTPGASSVAATTTGS